MGGPGPVADILEHHGVKGMHWGVHKNRDTTVHPLLSPGVAIDPTLPSSTKDAGKLLASLVGERYGFQITSLKAMETSDVDYDPRMIAFVKSTPGKSGGVIHATQSDVRKTLKDAEASGWFGKDCGTVPALLTHETAHAIFHASQQVKVGLIRPRVVGGNIKARDKALDAAMAEAERMGVRDNHEFLSRVSGYSAASGTREELEAEMFSQYHWSSNPPSFVTTWGRTLHQEMGIDSTPFREAVKHG